MSVRVPTIENLPSALSVDPLPFLRGRSAGCLSGRQVVVVLSLVGIFRPAGIGTCQATKRGGLAD